MCGTYHDAGLHTSASIADRHQPIYSRLTLLLVVGFRPYVVYLMMHQPIFKIDCAFDGRNV